MNGMEICVVRNVMPFERADHVLPSPPLQHPRLLPNDFKRRPDTPLGQQAGQPFASIIVSRQQVVLSIEPKDDIDFGPGR